MGMNLVPGFTLKLAWDRVDECNKERVCLEIWTIIVQRQKIHHHLLIACVVFLLTIACTSREHANGMLVSLLLPCHLEYLLNIHPANSSFSAASRAST